MTIVVGLEVSGSANYLRLHLGDWEVRVGAWTLTLLWRTDPFSGGVYLEGRGTDRHLTWAELGQRAAFWRQ